MRVGEREWLETDGLGGFAMGCADLIPRRRYHAFFVSAVEPPTKRFALLNAVDAWIEFGNDRVPVSSFRFAPGVLHPDLGRILKSFTPYPWPTWEFVLTRDATVTFEFLMSRGSPLSCFRWSYHGKKAPAVLCVRPLLSVRDYHALHRKNNAFRFEAHRSGEVLSFHPYQGTPGLSILSNGSYEAQPSWYENFLYDFDRDRGFEAEEDLASPGILRFDLQKSAAAILATHDAAATKLFTGKVQALASFESIAKTELVRRNSFTNPMYRATEHYLVARGKGRSIIAGYPWFTDWGRDSCIALRGLCIATKEYASALSVLKSWGEVIDRGMVPNRFPDNGAAPEYNSVDASLWFIMSAIELLNKAKSEVNKADRLRFVEQFGLILKHYEQGTRYGIRADSDGLLFSGEPGVQLTWMDAKIGDFVVTPRAGKPVEIQALWLNCLKSVADLLGNSGTQWSSLYTRGLKSFQQKFWNSNQGCLYDVIDVDNRIGSVDYRVRPNQILAVGGLPLCLVEKKQASMIVERVEALLFTPHGLRTLAPEERGYAPHYKGGTEKRDMAYHMGTAWPWLLGAFCQAWTLVHGESAKTSREAYEKFIAPLVQQAISDHGGNIPEIADGDAPHRWRGAPFQAWSLGEVLRATVLLTGK